MRKNTISVYILRVGLAITFIWIGVLVVSDPLSWAGFIKPWAQNLLVFSLETTMTISGFLDIGIGILLLSPKILWRIGAVLGALHLASVLVVSGIDGITIRDVGLLASALALAFIEFPKKNEVISEVPDEV